jgi:steroid delta-isomerase-like uncharacterized protein
MGRFEAITEQFITAINRHDLDAAAATYAEDTVAYDPMYPTPLTGRDAIREDFAATLRAFPDVRFEVLELLEQGDVGTAEMLLTGTNTGPLTTPMGEMPPTGKRVELKGAVYIRMDDRGLVAEERRYYDTGSLMRALGVTPEAAEVGAH